VIFHDAEPSNWTWDPIAGAFYWHRFFRHQPDLNFDNPHVRRAVSKVIRFWLDMGVDGLRLDAIAHLYEREGTSCDNLPETHAFLKALRADVDRRYAGRVLLAEANQSPAETIPYFGDADECHMAFHFPLMPRLFIALKAEDAAPIVRIVEQTSGLPDACQWALFLRNHDELTVSAVANDEREFLFRAYAPESRMRLNHGIRRRLAPLLDNDRRRLVLAHALLLSLPGSPVLYYGDEIGMGDNTALADRDGVRTPMQWDDGLHGGFSAADATPILPVNDDPVYGYRVVNVESQERNDQSLLARIKQMIAARRRHPVFGRGRVEFLDTDNRHVLAFLRCDGLETIIVVANLARSSQSAVIQLPPSAIGAAMTEILNNEIGPSAGAGPHMMTLEPYACSWFQLVGSGSTEITRSAAARKPCGVSWALRRDRRSPLPNRSRWPDPHRCPPRAR
jgi:maltose alpha-D-glucosyltransferase/alpha-amylase